MNPKLTNVFRRTHEAYRTGSRLIVEQGGQGSSKTFSVLQMLYLLARYKPPKHISIVSYALPHLRSGCMTDYDKIIQTFGEAPVFAGNQNKTTHSINGSLIEFFGIEGNIAKAHGPRRDILFINEANRKITYEVYDQLSTRTQECTIIDFNPDREFWLHEKVIPNFTHTLIKSNYLDNKYLPENELNNILSKKDKPGFENWWKVYGLGELGSLEGTIFPNWSHGEFPLHLAYGYGCDFGFNDPDTLVKVAVDERAKKIYCDERIYKSGNSSEQLRLMISSHCNRNELIVADCADARMIGELSRYFNIKPVDKAKWTVAEAIKIMQDYEIIITDTSHNLAKELNNYVWADKKAGVPLSGFNHLIDAVRYYFMTQKRSTRLQTWHS